MQEYVTDAIVLDVIPRGEFDREVSLYTRALGRIDAFAMSSRKPSSKFSPHLDILNLVTVRLVEKNRVTITDAATLDRFEELRGSRTLRPRALDLLHLIRSLAPRFSEESEVWNEIISQFSKPEVALPPFMSFFGYDTMHARCGVCETPAADFFSVRDQAFFCTRCGSKFPRNELIYVV